MKLYKPDIIDWGKPWKNCEKIINKNWDQLIEQNEQAKNKIFLSQKT